MIDPAEVSAWLSRVAAEPWLMEPRRLQAFLSSAGQEPMSARGFRGRFEDDLPFELRDGVAHIPIAGVMLQSVPWWMGRHATATPRVREAVQAAVSSDRVRSILLRISSPGGSVAGVGDLADAVHGARSKKPIHAHAESMAGSAAYWVGSQASRFTAEPTAEIGSIGAYRAIVDDTKFYDTMGVKVHLVRSGPQKGTGHPGVVVSDAELAHQQTLIDGLADLFVGAVARGRRTGIETIEPSATGATWLAADAVKRGLIDAVEHADNAHQTLTVAGGSDLPPARLANVPASEPAQAQEPAMSITVATPPAAPEVSTPAQAATTTTNTAAAPAEADAGLRDRLAQLETELKSERAKTAALEGSLVKLQRDRKSDAIEAAVQAGKIAPAGVEVWQRLAEAVPHTDAGLDDVKAQISKLPRLTRPDAQGHAPADTRDTEATMFTSAESDELKKRGKDPAKITRASKISKLLGDGRAELADGSIVNARDYLDGKVG